MNQTTPESRHELCRDVATRPLRLAICGPGRHGKDTVACWLAQNTTLRYRQSTSEAAAEIMFETFRRHGIEYPDVQACFQDRHQNRAFWADTIWAYNQPDGMRLYREMVESGHDILNGIRRAGELDACVLNGLVDLKLYCDASRRHPPEPSCELGPDDCDIVVPNNGTLDELHGRLARLACSLGVLKIPTVVSG